MKKSTALLVFFFGIILTSFAQVTDVKFLVEYNDVIEQYDCKIYIAGGTSTSYPERIQFNSQYTIVVPNGSQITIDSLYNPKENNQLYTGTIPCLWEFSAWELSPPTQPEHDFYAISPYISPPSAYNDLNTGDTITLFSISVNVDPCENVVRTFENDTDPSSMEMPGGGDFSNGFSLGGITGGIQLYAGNLYSEYGNAYITLNDSLEICIDECIILEPTLTCLGDSLHYEWSTGDTTETIEICPTEATNYYLIVKDTDDNELDSIPLFVDFGSLIITPESETTCAGQSMNLISCNENVLWSSSASNPSSVTISNTTGISTSVTFTEDASGIYDFICSLPGQSDTVRITVNPIAEIELSTYETCVGAIEFATSNLEGGTWDGFDPSISTINQSGTISTYSQGVATYMFTSDDGCSSISDPLVITQDIDAVFTGSDMICLGQTTTVSPNSGGTWSSADAAIASVTAGGVVIGVGYGTTSLVFTAINGCTSNYLTLHVNGPAIGSPESENICIGDVTIITPAVGGTWSSSDDAVATIDNSGNITGVGEGTASFIFTDASTLCMSYSSSMITVNAVPKTQITESNTICVNGISALIPATGGTWTSSDPLVATIDNNGNVVGHSVGYAVFTFYNLETGCNSLPSDTLWIVDEINVTFTGDDRLCIGETSSVSPNIGGTWTSNNTSVATIEPNTGLITAVSQGFTTFTFTSSTIECTGTSTGLVVDPIPTISLSGPNQICVGNTTNISPSTGGTWTSSNPIIATIDNSGTITGISPGNANFVFISTATGCASNSSEPVQVVQALEAIAPSTYLCGSETMSLIPGFGGTWVSSAPAVASVNAFTGLVTPISNGVVIFSFTDAASGCTASTAEVTVGALPSPNANNNGPLCEGENLNLFAEDAAGATYTWTGPNGFVSSEQNPTLSEVYITTSGTYCVLISAEGCESIEDCTEVVVRPTPITPTASNNSPVCGGEDIHLVTDAVAGADYSWYGPNGFYSNEQNPTISNATLANSGSYCVLITIDGCDSDQACTDVYVIPSPASPIINTYINHCEEEDIELNTDSVVGALYYWTGPNGYASNDQNPVVSNATLSDEGTYCLVITIDGCDSEKVCKDINVNPIPSTPTTSNNSPICEGGDLQLTTAIVTDATYAWTGPNGYASSEQNPIIVGATLAQSGNYCLIITVDGCDSYFDCTDVNIISGSSAPTISSSSPICEGDDLEISTVAISGASYSWTGPNGFTSADQNITIPNASPFETGTYCLIITIDECESQEECIDIFINPTPSTPIPSNNSPICEGGIIKLTTDAVTDGTYAWTGPDSFTSSQQNPLIFNATPSNNGNYCLIVTVDGCSSEEYCTDVFVSAIPSNPSASNNSPICEGEDMVFTAEHIEGATYQWYYPTGEIFSTEQNPVISGLTASDIGIYCLSVNIDGCESAETCLDVIVSTCLDPHSSCSQIEPDDIICDYDKLSSISGVLSDQESEGDQPTGSLCDNDDEAHNAAWFGFVALEGDYEIIINSEICVNENQTTGLKVGIYSSCEFTEENVVFCETTFNSNIQTRVSSTFFTPGETYYLSIDGYEGSICDYSIDIEGFYDNTFCTDLSKVTGVAYIDANENGTYENGETLLRNALISLSPGNFSVLTNDEGKYIINTPKGGATLTAKMNEGYWINNELVIEDLTIFEDCVEGIDFGFIPNLFYQEAKVSVSNTITRCDWETRFYFTVENTGTTDLDPTLEFEFDDKASYFSTNQIGLQVNGNVAAINMSAMAPFEVREFWILLKMPSGSAVLPILDFKTSVTNSAGVEMDTYEHSEQLRCSYDPNDKREYPNREGEENLTLMDEELEYTIRFQNNGNDTAFLVKIIDPLDSNIDASTIRVINSSHAVETCIENENLIFIFEDINLVDSMTNYEGSQGFVSFRCNTKEGRAENTIVHNTADIIFDSNIPIVTNTTINTLVSELCTNVTSEIDIEICDGDNYNGWDESGTYTEVFPLLFGCDSTVLIHLDVQGITYSAQDITVCEGDNFEVNGKEYTLYESQEIRDTSINAIGCISDVFIFDVLVNPIQNINIDTTICEGLEYEGLTESGIYTMDSFDVVTGCDIITTINLDVLPISDPACIVGTEDLTSAEVTLYPNPVLDVYFIESASEVEKVTIYSMDYQKIKERTYPRGTKKLQLNADGFALGMYFVAIKSNGKVIYKKFLRN